MSEEHIRSQTEVFEQAKQTIAAELDEEMLLWDFSKMMEELQRAIESCRAASGNNKPVRFFSRHYLNMGGERYNEVRGWMSGQTEMSAENITAVLTTLKALRGGSLEANVPEKPVKKVKREIPETEPVEKKETPGSIRGFIDHTTTMMNSLMIMASELGMEPEDPFDGDKIKMRIALRELCKSFGIEVVFPEPKAALSRPVTKKDLAGLAIPALTTRRQK